LIKNILITILLLAALGLFGFLCQAKTITISGNVNYSSEMIKEEIFDKKIKENTIYQFIMGLLDKKEEIPYIMTYEVKYKALDNMDVQVYEKEPVAYIVNDQGYILFDKDGIVLRIEDAVPEGLPFVTGIEPQSVNLFEAIPVEDGKVFSMLKNLVNHLDNLHPDRILINDKNEMELYFQNIIVKLGTDEYLENKIDRYIAIMPELEGRSGILYMEDVNENTDKVSFIKTKQ